jgi:hypothetical protein
MNESFKKNLINAAIAFLAGTVTFCLVFFLRQDFSSRGASDASFFAGALLLLTTLLYFIGRTGIFDLFSYTMNAWWQNMRTHPAEQWANPIAYKEHKKENRRKKKVITWPFLAMAFLSIAASVVFTLIYLAHVGW